jgi:hypothetical protein
MKYLPLLAPLILAACAAPTDIPEKEMGMFTKTIQVLSQSHPTTTVSVSRDAIDETSEKSLNWPEVFEELHRRFGKPTALRRELLSDTVRNANITTITFERQYKAEGIQELQLVFQGDTLTRLTALETHSDLLSSGKARYFFDISQQLEIQRTRCLLLGDEHTYKARYLLTGN